MKIFQIVILLLLSMHLVSSVEAHGIGNEIRKEIDGYLFEFGIESDKPKANEKIVMTFSFHNSSTQDPIEAESLWLRISKGDKIFFSTNDLAFKNSGPISFVYLFPEAGKYSIDISTKYKSKEVAANFTVEVSEPQEKLISYGFLIILIAVFIFLKFRRYKSKNKK